jgi:phosphoglycerol transferase MdoB-like AlkP superfamily enzyme
MRLGAFADAVDAVLDDNGRTIAFAAALLGAHLVLGLAAIAQRWIPRSMVGLNLAVAATILLYKASEYLAYPALIEEARDDLTGDADVKLILFEAIVAVAAGFAFAGRRVAAAASVAAFVVHALAAAAIIVFFLTFHLDRLI